MRLVRRQTILIEDHHSSMSSKLAATHHVRKSLRNHAWAFPVTHLFRAQTTLAPGAVYQHFLGSLERLTLTEGVVYLFLLYPCFCHAMPRKVVGCFQALLKVVEVLQEVF
jgi:hypothetical protein